MVLGGFNFYRFRNQTTKTKLYLPNSTKFATFAKSTESIFFSSSHIMIKYLLLTIMLLLASQAQDAFAQQKICKGTTSKGTKCTREAEPGYNFCYYHLTQDPNVKQCEAKTKKSTRCKFPAEKGSKYCKLHDPSAVKCKATTKKGTKCSRPAQTQGYCSQHYKMHKEGKI